MENFGDRFLNISWNESDFERVLNNSDGEKRDNTRELQSLGFKINQ